MTPRRSLLIPRATVLIGAYDNAATLPRAIASALSQTVGDIEILVVDDGSRDATPEIVQGIRDRRLRYLRLRHTGIAQSLNRGVREAWAPIIVVQDADDWSHPERVARQLAVLESCPEVAVVGVSMHEVDGEGRRLRPRTGAAVGDIREALLRFNPLPNGAAAFRRDVFLARGGYDPRYRFACDYDLWMRLSEQYTVVMLDEPLATRTLDGMNASSRHERAQILESIRIRMTAMRRRRTLDAAPAIARAIVAVATPTTLKRWRRRRLQQAP